MEVYSFLQFFMAFFLARRGAVFYFRTMFKKFALLLGICAGTAAVSGPLFAGGRTQGSDGDTVILLHGMWRNARAMAPIEAELKARGYHTINLSYPSTRFSIEELAAEFLHPVVAELNRSGARVHFVTHSMGGILVRYYLETHPVKRLGRVVMIAPPNQGVEVADRYGDWELFRRATGPAGQQLGTGQTSLPRALGPVRYELGVIAGKKGGNILSCMIPGDDDGIVSVASTKVQGMRDFLILDQNHYFIKQDENAIQQTALFLATGHFQHDTEEAIVRRN